MASGGRKSELVTGTFMLAALGVLVFLAFKPVRDFLSPGREFVCEFDDVGLLQKDDPVAVAGLIVGRVRTLVPKTETKKVVVTFDVKKEVADVLGQETKATIGSQSLLGNKFIAIEPSYVGTAIVDLKANPPYRMACEPKAADVMAKAGPVMDKVNSILTKVDTALTKEKMDEITGLFTKVGKALDDADALILEAKKQALDPTSGTVAKLNGMIDEYTTVPNRLFERVDDLKADLKHTMKNLDDLLAKGGSSLDEVVKMLNDPVTGLKPKLDRILESTNSLLARVDKKLDDKFFDDVHGVVTNANGAVSDARTLLTNTNKVVTNEDLFGSLYELRLTLQEAKLLMNSLRADPSQVIFGGPGDSILLRPREAKDETGERAGGRIKPYDY